jgi:hypothetical protein
LASYNKLGDIESAFRVQEKLIEDEQEGFLLAVVSGAKVNIDSIRILWSGYLSGSFLLASKCFRRDPR